LDIEQSLHLTSCTNSHQHVKSHSVVHHTAPSSHPKKFVRTLPVQTEDECPGAVVASSYARHTIAVIVKAQVVVASSKTFVAVG